MNTMRYAFAILGLAVAPAAHAAVMVGSFTPSGGPTETFDVNSTPVFTTGGNLFDYTLTNDSAGATSLTIVDGLVFGPGTAFVETSNSATAVNKDFFSPPPNDPSGALIPGVYSDSFEGSVLTLGSLAVPEPAAWALLLAGVALTGAALRQDRRRRQPALVIG